MLSTRLTVPSQRLATRGGSEVALNIAGEDMFGEWIDRRSVDSCIILEPCHEPKVGHGLDETAGARYWHFPGLFPESHSVVDYWFIHPSFCTGS